MIQTPHMDALARRMDDGYDPSVQEIEDAYTSDVCSEALRLAYPPEPSRFWSWWPFSLFLKLFASGGPVT